MTNLDDNLALLSPCMFANGNSSVDVRHSQEVPSSCTWCHDGKTNSYSKTDNIITWSGPLALTNEPPPLHTSTTEPYPWKSSNFDERESAADDIITNCCGENISKRSEESNVTFWKSDLILDDEDTTDQSVGESSPWSDVLSAPSSNSRGTSPKRRGTSRAKKTKVSTATYKHVPHRDKPPQLVARRNARERRRVQAVNSAFSRLRKVVPIESNRGKRVSKVKTLHKAIEYINHLQDLLIHSDTTQTLMPNSKDPNKENTGQLNNRWNHGNTFDSGFRTGGSHVDSLEDLLEDFEDDI